MTPVSGLLDSRSIEIVRECLQAAAEGPFFPEWEFQTLMGVDREVVRRVRDEWPDQTVEDQDFTCAVAGSLNNLLGYPHGHESEWSKYISADAEQVRIILKKLVAAGL
jgi:hypothetical protein